MFRGGSRTLALLIIALSRELQLRPQRITPRQLSQGQRYRFATISLVNRSFGGVCHYGAATGAPLTKLLCMPMCNNNYVIYNDRIYIAAGAVSKSQYMTGCSQQKYIFFHISYIFFRIYKYIYISHIYFH